jgi:hypothetical protein
MDEPKYTMADFCCERYIINDLKYYELLDEIENPRQGKRKETFWKWLISIGLLGVALIPTWIFIFLYHIAGPSNFMEKFVTIGVGLFFGGGVQLFLLILWICLVAQIKELSVHVL